MFFSIPWQILNKFGYSVTHFEYHPAFKGLNELYLPGLLRIYYSMDIYC